MASSPNQPNVKRRRWWLGPLVLGMLGLAAPAIWFGYTTVAYTPTSVPIDLRLKSQIVHSVASFRYDSSYTIALFYDLPSGQLLEYCSNAGLSADGSDSLIPDCGRPPRLAVTVVDSGRSVILRHGKFDCCHGEGSSIGRILGRAMLEPGRAYLMTVKVVTPRPDLEKLNPRIEFSPSSDLDLEASALYSLLLLAVCAIVLIVAASWAFVAFRTRRR